jgi:hypothetical protein
MTQEQQLWSKRGLINLKHRKYLDGMKPRTAVYAVPEKINRPGFTGRYK